MPELSIVLEERCIHHVAHEIWLPVLSFSSKMAGSGKRTR
jgi:hypothetical protein